MVQLLDLPDELLVEIFRHLGGRELRRKGHLTICRRWFQAAHEVFLSGIDVNRIFVHGISINRLIRDWGYGQGRTLMHKNTRDIDIMLNGVEDEAWPTFDPTLGITVFPDPPQETDSSGWAHWRNDVVTPILKGLFNDLPRFTVLERFSFTAGTDSLSRCDPRVAHTRCSTVESLIHNVPLICGLKKLTLDLHTGVILDSLDQHLCEHVARIIPRVESVRLRLKVICPDVFNLPKDLAADDVRLKTLVVKLHLPHHESFRHPDAIVAKCCNKTAQEPSNDHSHIDRMILAAREFREMLQVLLDPATSNGPLNAGVQSSVGEGRQKPLRSLKLFRLPLRRLAGRKTSEKSSILHAQPSSIQTDDVSKPHPCLELFRISCCTLDEFNFFTVDCLTMQMFRLAANNYLAYHDTRWFEDRQKVLLESQEYYRTADGVSYREYCQQPAPASLDLWSWVDAGSVMRDDRL